MTTEQADPIHHDVSMTEASVAFVALGAAVGAPTRWYVDLWTQRRWAPIFPWGTFMVNIVGSALLGFLMASWSRDSAAVTLVGVGFCGALTTFSSYAWESHRLAEDGATGIAVANVVGTPLVCVAAAVAGWWLGT